MEFRWNTNATELLKVLNAVERALEPENIDSVIELVGQQALAMLKEATPKGMTGNLANGWVMETPKQATRLLLNTIQVNTVARGRVSLIELLHTGTGVFGPSKRRIVPVTAKRLYVPLTKRASYGYTKGLVYGQDYVMLKSVRGTRRNKQRRPIERVEPKVLKLLEKKIDQHIDRAIKKTR